MEILLWLVFCLVYLFIGCGVAISVKEYNTKFFTSLATVSAWPIVVLYVALSKKE